MPTLRQIFGHAINTDDTYVVVRDRKPNQCSFITPIDEFPFIKRCTNKLEKGSKTCEEHSGI